MSDDKHANYIFTVEGQMLCYHKPTQFHASGKISCILYDNSGNPCIK